MKLLSILVLLLSFAHAATGQSGEESRNLIFDAADLKIIQRADSILSDSMKWNRKDDRECADDIKSGKYSLYCALYKASIDVTGAYVHRRAAMQIVRFTVKKYDSGSIKDHRLMDWNNSTTTSFAMLKMVLKESIEIVKKQLTVK